MLKLAKIRLLVDFSAQGSGTGWYEKSCRLIGTVLRALLDDFLDRVPQPFRWGSVMAIAKRCHDQARSVSKHVMTTIRIEDEDGGRRTELKVRPGEPVIANVPVSVPAAEVVLQGDLSMASMPKGGVLFAHGSGSSRHSPRNRYVCRGSE